MAVVKIHAIKATVNKSIDYIMNPEKTNGELLVSGFNVTPNTAHIEFAMTKNLAEQMIGNYTACGSADNLAYHMIQSFKVGEKITAQEAHEIGKKYADEFLKGKYEYVIATHIDQEHIHNHIILNSTSFIDYKKLETKPYKTIAELRKISDKICTEYNLSVIKSPQNIKKSRLEWEMEKTGKLTWKQEIRNQIDDILQNNKAKNYDDFKQQMEGAGFTVKEGKHLAFKAPGQERFCRGKTLGDKYTKDEIINCIDTNLDLNINTETKTVTIDKVLIKKVLSNGFITRVPGSNNLLYLSTDDANWKVKDKTIEATLKVNQSYYFCNLHGMKVATVSYADIASKYDKQSIKRFVGNFDITGERSRPLCIDFAVNKIAERYNRKESLHKIADSLIYARRENIKYFSDFNSKKTEIKSMISNIKKEIKTAEGMIDNLKVQCKVLTTYEKYLPISEGLTKAWNKGKYKNKYSVELSAFEYSKNQLDNKGINPDKISVQLLVTDIKMAESEISKLVNYLNTTEEKLQKIADTEVIIKSVLQEKQNEKTYKVEQSHER